MVTAENAVADCLQLPGGVEPEGFGVGFALSGKHAGREAVGRIIIEYRDAPLGDDGAVIVFIVCEMHGAA